MPYDETFFELYREYLNEPSVRAAHDEVFRIAQALDPAFGAVIDFGCGRWHEFRNYASPHSYLGVDTVGGESVHSRCADYRTMDLSSLPSGATAFVSLFSTEITAPWEENRHFYERVFAALPNVRAGLVSGFYYADRRFDNPVQETGGIVSWQTLETPEESSSDAYFEARLILPVPSKLFGPTVYEVWKFFSRA